MISKTLKNRMVLVIGPLLFLFFIFFPIPQLNDLSIESRIVLATTIWMGLWWITEVIPIYITALLPLVLFPSLLVTDIGDTSIRYADRIVFLFLGGFILAKAVEKSNLHTRFAFHILRIFGTDPKYIVAAFILVTGFLSAWMSNTATTMLMLPIASAIISQIGNKSDQTKFANCILLSIAYSASIGGMATLIGTPPNAIFASLSQSMLDIEISFTQWSVVAMPISGISLFILWVYITRIGVKITHIKSIVEGERLIHKQLSKLGNLTRDEKIVACIFMLTALAWITRGMFWKDLFPAIDDSTIVLISAISLFLIPSTASKSSKRDDGELKTKENGTNDIDKKYSGQKKDNENSNGGSGYGDGNKLLNWNTAVQIPWGVLILIGGGLALANGFTSTGLDDWIASQLSFLKGLPIIIIILVIVTLSLVASEIISNTATAALLIPISISVAASLGIDPLILMIPLTMALSYGFIMPAGTPPNAIVFATGHLTASKMAKVGLPMDIIGIILVTILSILLIPFLLQ
jgi:sodium-dependent dicarboxylate transporter 2/3/5